MTFISPYEIITKLQESIRQVRKHGSVLVDSRDEAQALVAAAAAEGYTFGISRLGWAYRVADLDA